MMYETYELSRKEWGIYGAEGILGIAVMDYVFYRNAGLFLVLLPVGMLFPLMLRKQLKKRRLETLRGQFKDAILAVASGLNAGYSVENAFAVSLKEMEEIHGSDSMIAQEIRLILRKVPGRCEKFFRCFSCSEKKRRGTDEDHRQDRGDHRRKNPDPGGDPDGNRIEADGAEDHERDSDPDRGVH